MTDRFIGAHTIFDDAGKSRTPYMRRYWIGRLRLHIFYRGDNDPDHHDHPWDFWTFPLTSYVEEVAEPIWMSGPLPTQYHPRRQVVRAFRLHYRPATHCHRVLGRYSTPIALYGGKERNPRFDQGRIITLVWRGRSDARGASCETGMVNGAGHRGATTSSAAANMRHANSIMMISQKLKGDPWQYTLMTCVTGSATW